MNAMDLDKLDAACRSLTLATSEVENAIDYLCGMTKSSMPLIRELRALQARLAATRDLMAKFE